MINLEELRRIDPTDKHNWGPKAWRALNEVCDAIPCPSCRKHCKDMIMFEHDLVNIKLEKPMYNEEHFDKYMQLIRDTAREERVYVK
jgi:hypothetical protein